MEIIWSIDAVSDYHATIDYLLEKWSEQSAITFLEEINTVLQIIQNQPKLYPLAGYTGVRKAVIRKQVSLFYKQEKDKIVLIRIWNNYQNPGKFKF